MTYDHTVIVNPGSSWVLVDADTVVSVVVCHTDTVGTYELYLGREPRRRTVVLPPQSLAHTSGAAQDVPILVSAERIELRATSDTEGGSVAVKFLGS